MTAFQSLIFYMISFGATTVFYELYAKHNKKIFLIISFIIPLLISSLRYMVGSDYEMYAYMSRNSSDVDLGFNIISYISNVLGGGNWIFAIYGLITLFFFYLGLSNIDKKSRPFALFLFLFLYFTTSFNIMRQMLSISIFFYSLRYIKENQMIRYYVLNAVAFIFHTSALILFFLFPFFATKKKWIKILFVALMIATSFLIQSLIIKMSSVPGLEHFAMYSSYVSQNFNNYSFYIEVSILVFILFFKKKLLKYDNFNASLIFIYTIGVILTLSGFISPFIKRIALYFCIPSILLLSEIPQTANRSKNKQLLYLIIALFAIVKFIISAYVLRQANIIPYNVIQL